ncbi:hypothetical protein [Hymenobacter weizhouensis]|uniref:hypothetical protein n=1 Tax=Hymenobacter sp. YIM 151500-1 TaxID=2987689 RepID=UPI002227A0DD|nr:hypothetical protein [Hymenobacter sp. YIM 151500-1]UYZ63960.1 hypothetical protein OIS53_03735 [Hymenobacter sp. YIM 151500-1]
MRLAQRRCCIDIDEETGQRRPAQGLTGCSYQVLHNDGRLLSFEFNLEHTGAYSWQNTQHAVFDVRTGQRLRLTDVVAETPARVRQLLRVAINRRLTKTLNELWEESQDSAEVQALAERFTYNLRTHQVEYTSAAEPTLEDFTITARGITIFYQPWLPPAWWPHSPESAYFFPFTALRSRLR